MKARVLLPLILLATVSRADDQAPTNPVAALEARLEAGTASLAYGDVHGYLPALLAALAVPQDSQVLTFTRSSLQFDRISPKAPRAIYFGPDVAVGQVHDGKLIEIIANDRRGAAAFYTLDAARSDKPRFTEEGDRCVACHGMVNAVAPGWIVASIAATEDGTPHFTDIAHPFDLTDQTRPFEQRWGGWYVTGRAPAMRHMGNVTAPDPGQPFDLPPGITLASLSDRFDTAQTLKPTSDIVALMTLEHQAGFINRLYALNGSYSDKALADLVAYMTFADEVPLPGPVSGDSGFTAAFAKQGPHDAGGRSLRDFDLQTRLFRYPLSYMVYSGAFDSLKPEIKEKLWRRLYDILHMSGPGRDAIAILAATKPGLPAYWKP